MVMGRTPGFQFIKGVEFRSDFTGVEGWIPNSVEGWIPCSKFTKNAGRISGPRFTTAEGWIHCCFLVTRQLFSIKFFFYCSLPMIDTNHLSTRSPNYLLAVHCLLVIFPAVRSHRLRVSKFACQYLAYYLLSHSFKARRWSTIICLSNLAPYFVSPQFRAPALCAIICLSNLAYDFFSHQFRASTLCAIICLSNLAPYFVSHQFRAPTLCAIICNRYMV